MRPDRSARLRDLGRATRHDVRLAWRLFVKQPLFSAVVVLTLGIGIGLNTAVFSAVEAELLRPPPGVRDADELLRVYRTAPGAQWGSNSVPHFFAVRSQTSDVFSGVAATAWRTFSITIGETPRTVFGQVASANYFTVLGVTAARGRLLLPEEDIGWRAHPVIVLSDGFWRDAFGADPGIIGRVVPVNGQNVSIVGVAPPRFRGLTPVVEPAFWIPLTQLPMVWPSMSGEPSTWTVNFLDVVARRRSGVSEAQALRRLEAIAMAQRAENPAEYRERGMTLIKATDAGITPSARQVEIGLFAVVMIVVSMLLLLGCVNVANLFLARASDRSREMAVRVALGASRLGLIRQLMVESLLYASLSAVAGLCLAAWAIGVVNRIALPMNITARPDLTLSVPVLVWTLVVTMLTTVVFGLWPALRATRPSLVPALKGESPAGGSRSRVRRAMVIAQAALSALLLAGAGFFLANLREATRADKGFASEGLVLAGLDPSLQGYSRAEIVALQDRLLERLRSSAQVSHAALVAEAPLGVGSSDADVDIPGYVPTAGESMAVFYAATTPTYFATMAIPVRGRDFEARDDSLSVPVVIVNQRFVDRFFPGTNGLGQSVRFAGRSRTVVGVVPTGKYRSLGEAPTAFLWLPQAQSWRAAMTLVVRSRAGADAVMPLVRREIAALDPNMPISSLRTMDAHLAFALLPARIAAVALASFGALGLLLAAIGIYGVMTHAVVQRTREIGIRLALGASPVQIERSLLRDGMSLVAIGLSIGLGVAALSARLLQHLLYDAGGSALPVYAAIVAVLSTVALAATILPARRAARVDPALAMRSE